MWSCRTFCSQASGASGRWSPADRNPAWAAPGGLICNSRLVDNERELVEAFAGKLNTRLLYFLPRDNVVQRAELQRRTVIDHEPDCPQAGQYRALAKALEENRNFTVPTPMGNDALEALLLQYCPVN